MPDSNSVFRSLLENNLFSNIGNKYITFGC